MTEPLADQIIRQTDVFDFRHRLVYLDFSNSANQQE